MQKPEEHPYEMPTISGSGTSDTTDTNIKRPSNRCLIITIAVSTAVLVMAIIAATVVITLTSGKQQSFVSTDEIESIKTKLASLTSKLDKTKTDLTTALDTTKAELATTNKNLATTVTALDMTKLQLDSTKAELATTNKNVDNLRKVNDTVYVNRGVFTATRATSLTGISSEQIIPYNTVIYNLGQDYDPVTGIFVCPKNGVYLFHVSILTYTSTASHYGVQIVKETVTIGATFEQQQYHSSSVTVFTHCAVGERVWVRLRTGYNGAILYGNYWPYFSGAFLYATN